MNTRDIACFFIGISVAMWGISLITDPWAQERYERMCRETARINNELLYKIDPALQWMPYLGQVMTIAAFIVMNRFFILTGNLQRLKYLSFFATLPVMVIGALYYNQYMYRSERFGGYKTIIGVLFTMAISSSIILGSFKTDCEIKMAQEKKIAAEKKREEAQKQEQSEETKKQQ